MKIFQIGFNRCGTVSLCKFFERNGIAGVHWDEGNLARRMYENHLRGCQLLEDYNDKIFFSDMEAEISQNGNSMWIFAHVDYFKVLDEQYPESKFILNTRNVDDWVRSRCKFKMGPNSVGGEYLEIFKRLYNADEDTVKQLWIAQWDNHHASVKEHFKDRPQDLLVYDIDKDNSQKIVDFVSPTYKLKAIPLPNLNASAPSRRMHQLWQCLHNRSAQK
jgi:hypothetical protein